MCVSLASQTSEESVRNDLEALLDQFFSPTVTNEQRINLSTSIDTPSHPLSPSLPPSFLPSSFLTDELLESFAQQQGVWLWRYCVYFLQTSTNEHLLMYSLNLLEVHTHIIHPLVIFLNFTLFL